MENRSAGKQALRDRYLSKRDRMTKSERLAGSMRIWKNLKGERKFQEEILLSENGKRVFAPRVEGFDIEFYEIHSLADLRPGYQGIREPQAREETKFTGELYEKNKCLLLRP